MLRAADHGALYERFKTPRERQILWDRLRASAERTASAYINMGEHRKAEVWTHAAEKAISGNMRFVTALMRMKHLPVLIDEFLDSEEYWGTRMEMWPTLRPDISAACPDVMMGEKHRPMVLLGGATGTGKTAYGHTVNAYHLYCFTCFREPQQLFGLTPDTPVVFLFTSPSTLVTKRVIYTPFRNMFLNMPYAGKYVPHDKHREGELILDGNLHVVPALAALNAMIGQAIAGALVDEINFMSVVENSKQVAGAAGQGGYYDQAEVVFSNIERRRNSRFITKGPSFGVLCVSSSTRYKGDFLDRQIDRMELEAEEAGTTTEAYIVRRKQYEMQPKFALVPTYPKFRFLVGTDNFPGRVLKDHEVEGEHYPTGSTIEMVPLDYKKQAERDPDGFSRDVIGVASLSISPFIQLRHKVIAAVLRGLGVDADEAPDELPAARPWVVKQDVDLGEDGFAVWDDEVIATIPHEVRKSDWFVHVDLSISNDSCGIAFVRVVDWREQLVGSGSDATIERQPVFEVGCTVALKPSPLKHVDPAEIRRWILQLKTFYGFNIYMVTYDGFQSLESINLLQSAGVRSMNISMDLTSEPYVYFRRALYEDRCSLTHHEALRLELVSLEHNKKKDKIDHPPRGSKDIADAVAGAVFAASKSRSVRTATTVQTGGERASLRTRPATVKRPAKVERPQSRFAQEARPSATQTKSRAGMHPDDPDDED